MEEYLRNMLTYYEHQKGMNVADFNKIAINKDFNIYTRMSSDGQITLIMGVCFDVQNRKWFWWTPRTEHIDGLFDFLKAFTKIEKGNVTVTERSKKWE